MSIYETVTARILSQLDAGVVPWRKTWTTGLPKSLTTGKEYRGANILILGMASFSSRYWVTYREAQRLGGHVRRGERASPVVFWKWRTPQELARLREKSGREDLAPCVPFTAAVFNFDQVEGITRPEDDVPNRRNDRFEVADKMLDVMPDQPEIVHVATREPSYSPRFDRVTLPHLSQFESAAEYYATLFHELVHATGAEKRLNRFSQVEGDRFERYSFEELVAEFGAAFLGAFAGIESPGTEALQASYIQGWSKALRKDQRLVVRAASAAQRATDYIRGKVILDRPEPESHPSEAIPVGAPMLHA
jgi:antirestriction protein ArdC